MVISNARVRINLAEDAQDLADGLAFVNDRYYKAFGVIPSPPDYLLIARIETRVVGTIGINVWHNEKRLRLNALYQFDPSVMEVPVDLQHSVEFGRWTCDSPGVACALLQAATCFSLNRGARHVLCEHSPAVNRVCRSYGIVFYPIKDATLNQDAIEEHHRAFYDSTDAHLYVFELEQAQVALTEYLDTHSQ